MKAKSLFSGPEDDSLLHIQRYHIKQHTFTPDVCALLSFDGCPSQFNNSKLQEEMDCEFTSASDKTGFLLASSQYANPICFIHVGELCYWKKICLPLAYMHMANSTGLRLIRSDSDCCALFKELLLK